MRASVVVILKNRQDPLAGAGPFAARPGGRFSQILKEFGAAIMPEATTAAGIVIDVPDMDRASRLAEALRALDDVETAYAKPGEELP